MTSENQKLVTSAKNAAVEILLHNAKGPFENLPRTAGWGYPEPYTRDLLISLLGIASSKNQILIDSLKKVLETLATNQSERGEIPSLVHDSDNLGSSDTTPLFLLAVGIFRKVINDPSFLSHAVQKALIWMEYQCPTSHHLIAQQPTSDWRDEQWVLGYGLFVNTLMFASFKLLDLKKSADNIGYSLNGLTYSSDKLHLSTNEGLAIADKPYYALWSYKVYSSERFDLLGNSIAILSGLAPIEKAKEIIHWIQNSCDEMRQNNVLAINVTPNFFPFIQPDDADWLPRYAEYNNPGDYHNGGIWPFISGFYIASLVAAREYDLAEKELVSLTKLIKIARNPELEFGFNEWYKAQDGKPTGQDWQTWSASNYLYAANCVEQKSTLFFE